MFLPTPSTDNSPQASWQPYDTRWTEVDCVLDSNGGGTVQLPETPDTERWQVDRITVATSAGSSTLFWLYLGAVDQRKLIDGTNAGDFDVNDTATPIEVAPGNVLIGQWTNGSPGALATMRVHYVVERRPDGF